MELSSSVFKAGSVIPALYTCDGRNISPPLTFEFVSQRTQSLVLIVDDPDASGGTWLHWTVWDIQPTVKEIAANSVPLGAREGVTSFGTTGYGGPCPPRGVHHYFFKLYALDVALSLKKGASISELEAAMSGHVIDQAELVGVYERLTAR